MSLCSPIPGFITTAPAGGPSGQPEEVTAPNEIKSPALTECHGFIVRSLGQAGQSGDDFGTKVYTGAPIKIDAKNLDILDALRAIAGELAAQYSTADDVHGKLTLKLDNVPAIRLWIYS